VNWLALESMDNKRMMTRVKICGNTSLEDARAAVQAGADMLGFIFYDRSPRYVSPEVATIIVGRLRDEFGAAAPAMVGVFVDDPVEQVSARVEQVGLDGVQLHGSEPPVEVRQLQPYAFKAIRPQNRGDAEALVATYAGAVAGTPGLPDFLVDAHHPWKMGGTGQRVSLAVATVLARRYRVLLAGGLEPENVAEIVREARPWGVDVASGVESAAGIKDHQRVAAFIREAKSALGSNQEEGR
jgi:phosphoribosylanthranilate isomerase